MRAPKIRSAFLILAVLGTGCTSSIRKGAPPGQAPVTSAPTQDVTFVWRGEGQSVHVTGEFNGWNTTADPMLHQADGSWSLTKPLPPGRHTYSFVIDGRNWRADPNAKESVDDGRGGRNSVVQVGPAGRDTIGIAPAPAEPVVTPAGRARPPHVTPEGVVFTFAGNASTVHLAGEFNRWSTNADPLVRRADGTWSIVKRLGPGVHAYKFVVNGSVWTEDGSNPEARNDGPGGRSSIITVP
ncbi:MAG TPA: hypothetical protein VEY91_00245 [Candidatus Limnocylindria bacterium]|nr:hypothetical protein [Candidatus Limnocylindria bacterium]